MRKINVRNPNELEIFKQEISGFTSYGFPYKLDDLTEKGGNYTFLSPKVEAIIFSSKATKDA